MAEYIKRESAIEAIMSDSPDAHYQSWYAEKINEIPAADVEPVMRGRWIEHKKYIFGTMHDCSVCGSRILNNGHSWNYCPNCGARMEEVSE